MVRHGWIAISATFSCQCTVRGTLSNPPYLVAQASNRVIADSATIGRRIRRGKDWRWGDQDHNGEGKIVPGSPAPGWVRVEWDGGGQNAYRAGADGAYDLEYVEEGSGTTARSVDGVLVNKSTCKVGLRVQRGPDWEWGE